MKRVPTLIEKLKQLSAQGENDITVLDVDLMLDYTRVLYADLLDIRNALYPQQTQSNPEPAPATPNIEVEEEQLQTVAHTETNKTISSEISAKQDIAQEATHSYPIDIRTVIGINDKYLFINELFADDKSAYDEAIKKLNSHTNIDDATKWVRSELHSRYNWNEDDETVQSFYNVLISSFSST